jgi:transcriptional regulator with XRE-family HTH domain
MEIFTKIDAIMKAQGVSDADLADATGLPRMTIGNARRGKNITLANALRISKALGQPLNKIWAIDSEGLAQEEVIKEEVA